MAKLPTIVWPEEEITSENHTTTITCEVDAWEDQIWKSTYMDVIDLLVELWKGSIYSAPKKGNPK